MSALDFLFHLSTAMYMLREQLIILLMSNNFRNRFSTNVRLGKAPLKQQYLKDYRIQQQGVYNQLKTSIQKTFAINKNPVYYKLKEYSKKYINQSYDEKLEKMYHKIGVSLNPKRQILQLDGKVDVDFIARKYVEYKSKEKQKNDSREKLRSDVNNYYIGNTKEQKSFFQIQRKSLKNLQKHARKSCSFQKSTTRQKVRPKSARVHPYIELYSQYQKNTDKAMQQNSELFTKKVQPNEEQSTIKNYQVWQKQKKQVIKIRKDEKKVRAIQSAKVKRNSWKSKQQRMDFYIT